MIELTNTATGHSGNSVWLNPAHIAAVYPQHRAGGVGQTFVHLSNDTVYEVVEMPAEVLALINPPPEEAPE